MSIIKSFSINLKLYISQWGTFEKIYLLKGRSNIEPELLDKINEALKNTFVPAPAIKTTVEIGNNAEQKVMNQLLSISQSNSGFIVSDTSSMLNHGDIAVDYQNKKICIEVKCYSKAVPLREVDKYKMSLDHTEYNCGIMIQTEPCGFTKECNIKTPIDFKIDNGKPSIYLTGVDVQLLYPIIRMLITVDSITDDIDINELERYRLSLLSVYSTASKMRATIEEQKKITKKLEDMLDEIIDTSTIV